MTHAHHSQRYQDNWWNGWSTIVSTVLDDAALQEDCRVCATKMPEARPTKHRAPFCPHHSLPAHQISHTHPVAQHTLGRRPQHTRGQQRACKPEQRPASRGPGEGAATPACAAYILQHVCAPCLTADGRPECAIDRIDSLLLANLQIHRRAGEAAIHPPLRAIGCPDREEASIGIMASLFAMWRCLRPHPKCRGLGRRAPAESSVQRPQRCVSHA